MSNKSKRKYILFWLSQSVSQLGSSMTSYALIIWIYTQTHSAMSVSLPTFCSYLPYIIGSIFAGEIVDRYNKKHIMLISDGIAGMCSLAILILFINGMLEIQYVYIVNVIIGVMNAFQSPAATVAIGQMVSEEDYSQISGLNSFSSSLITVVTPMLAAAITAFWGLKGVLMIDMISFIIAITVLWGGIKINDITLPAQREKQEGIFSGWQEGIDFLKHHKGVFNLIISMALLNFFSRLTYENILPAMILARSDDNHIVLGVVSGTIGLGGIVGGMIVATVKVKGNPIKVIYYGAAISFLIGDLFMGLGSNMFWWIIAGLAASIPIPFIYTRQQVILYHYIPKEIQGRVFAVRNAIQDCTIPIGILLGGILADYLFEPFMASTSQWNKWLQQLVGVGYGSGMALMFICTGIVGCLLSVLLYRSKPIQRLQEQEKIRDMI